jgi:hypothetical protein
MKLYRKVSHPNKNSIRLQKSLHIYFASRGSLSLVLWFGVSEELQSRQKWPQSRVNPDKSKAYRWDNFDTCLTNYSTSMCAVIWCRCTK